MDKKIVKYFLIILLLVLFFVLGYFSASFLNGGKYEKGYQDGWNQLEKKVSSSLFIDDIDRDMAIKSLSGRIALVSKGSMEVKVNTISVFDDPVLDVRTVFLDDKTKIYKYVKKGTEAYQVEMEQYYQMAKNDKNFNEQDHYPSPYELKEVTLNDCKKGELVIVEAEKNIRNESEFKASKITIQPN